jgi:TonB-linked SusC/RagA family outer membrane protein
MKSKLLHLLILLFFWNIVSAQNIRVTGKVTTKEDGLSLPGVNVVIDGTAKGTITNAEGIYSIDVANADILSFSSVGYTTQKISVSGKTEINLVMSLDEKLIDELIVIGYGSKKKSDIVGAVSTIKPDELKANPTSNLQSLLTGKVPGMYVSVGSARPGGNSNITIRGLNSLKGSTEPLYIVDGIPVTSVNEININDVESISALKDASSQAIYGARASNGVILITTRKGSNTQGKINVSYSGFMSIQNVKPNFELFSGEEFLQLRREAYRGDDASAANGWIGSYASDSSLFTPLEVENINKGLLVDWLDLAFNKNVPLTKHDFTFSGGNDKTRYSASLGYFDQQGVRYSSGYKRYSGKLQIDQKVSEWISIGMSSYYNSYTQDQENSSWTDFMVFSPVAKLKADNGDLELYPLGDFKSVNPLWWNRTRKLQNITNRGIYNGYLEVAPPVIPGLKYRMNVSFDIRNNENDDFRSLKDPSKYLNKGLADVQISSTKNYLMENILSYEKKIAANHRLDFTLMQSAFERNYLFTESSATLLGNDFFGINSLNSAIESLVGRDETKRTMLSYMARVNYILKDRYLLNFTVRADGSSVFGANNKWGKFPSAAFAWNMNKESFMSSIDWINESKIRLSWGQIGNEAISPYGSLATADKVFYVSNGNPIVGYLPGLSLPNPNLKWETSTTLNAGYDFSIFDGRLSGEIDLYKRNTRDLLVDRTIPAGLGYTSMPDNLGEIENKGFEIALNGYVVSNEDFSWKVGGNFSVNKNKLLKGVLRDSAGVYLDDISNRWFINQPVRVYYDYKFDGIWQIDDDIANSHMPLARPGDVRVKDMDGNDSITANDRVVINREPKWIATFNTSVSYKNLRLSADVYIVQGVTRSSEFMSGYNYGGTLQGALNGIKRDYWTPENPSNETFRPHFTTLSEYMGSLDYKDASYIRLTNVTLSYDLPRKWLEKVKMSTVKVYVRGDNLITITDYLSLGPETNPDDYPETVNYTFGVNINF